MEKLFILTTIISLTLTSQAQTYAEWMQQRKTQRKYLIQQIAAFQTYLGYAKKGYEIGRKGLNAVGSIKKGEWDLHALFYGSLKSVNPSIKRLSKVADLVTGQIKVINDCKALVRGIKDMELLNEGEREVIEKTMGTLLSASLQNIEHLLEITTSGKLEMTDDERLSRLENVYEEMQASKSFLSSYSNSVKLLLQQRLAELNGIEISKKLNGKF